MGNTGVAASVLAFLLVVGALAGGYAGRVHADDVHANDVHADTQVIADGRVVIEEVFPLDEVFVVVQADEDGERGQVLGVVTIGSGQRYGVEVPIDTAELDGPTRLHVTLHRDANGDEEFTRGDDPPVETLERVVTDDFLVRQSDRPVRVLAVNDFGPQPTTGTIRVPLVEAARPGYVTLRDDDDGSPGRILGVSRVSPGRTADLAVEIEEPVSVAAEGRTRLWVLVHADDGDGEFDPDEDRPVTVDDQPVASQLPVDVNTSAVATRTPSTETTVTGSTTSSPTTLENATTSTTTETTEIVTEDGTAGTTTREPDDSGSGTLPTDGFGVGLAALAVLVVASVLARRNG